MQQYFYLIRDQFCEGEEEGTWVFSNLNPIQFEKKWKENERNIYQYDDIESLIDCTIFTGSGMFNISNPI